MSRGDSIYMQWVEKCRFVVSLVGMKAMMMLIVVFMTFAGLSVTASAQNDISSEGIYWIINNPNNPSAQSSEPEVVDTDKEKGALSSVAGFVAGVAVFLVAISVLGTIALQNEKNVYYKHTDSEFDDDEDEERDAV